MLSFRRSTLTKDKSTFDSMFSLDLDLRSHTISTCSSSIGPEGESDDNPIRLQGDSAEEFRALLWALYALPHDLMVALTPNANPLQLFHLSRITHKYQFRSIETWALTALTACYTRSLSSSFDSQNPSLAQITELAALCEQKELLDACITRWKRLLGESKDVSLAIDVSEKLGLRGLMGLAYHSMLLKGQEAWEQDEMLSREQRIRLLSGHYKLGKLWERLPNEPPVLNHSTRCTGKISFILPRLACILTILLLVRGSNHPLYPILEPPLEIRTRYWSPSSSPNPVRRRTRETHSSGERNKSSS